MANKTSGHILSSCPNLIGFCLLMITSLRISQQTKSSLVDEFSTIVALILTISCMLSFFSIRAGNERMGLRLEALAEILFFIAMTGIFLLLVFILYSLG